MKWKSLFTNNNWGSSGLYLISFSLYSISFDILLYKFIMSLIIYYFVSNHTILETASCKGSSYFVNVLLIFFSSSASLNFKSNNNRKTLWGISLFTKYSNSLL